MLTLLDRQLIYSYLKAYLVCLVSLLGLFIVVDLFTNLDNFAEDASGLGPFLERVLIYYGVKVAQIFDRLCEAVVLLAAMFTVAWMQRNNELLPLLSAGVSTRRVVRPVLLAAFVMLGLTVVNQELVLPNLDVNLTATRSDQQGEKPVSVQGGYESNGIHLSGSRAFRKQQLVKDFVVVFPGKDCLTTLQAREAVYLPPGEDARSGGWKLMGTKPQEIPGWNRTDILQMIAPGTYFLKTSEMDFDTMTRPKYWYTFFSTIALLQEIYKTHTNQVAAVAVVFHMRLTRPILGMLLVFMGLSIILRDQNRNVFLSAGMCLILCAVFFMALFFCKHLGDHRYLFPALAAWLPVMLFGPLSFVMFDAVHT